MSATYVSDGRDGLFCTACRVAILVGDQAQHEKQNRVRHPETHPACPAHGWTGGAGIGPCPTCAKPKCSRCGQPMAAGAAKGATGPLVCGACWHGLPTANESIGMDHARARVIENAAVALLATWSDNGLAPRVGDRLTPDSVEAFDELRMALRQRAAEYVRETLTNGATPSDPIERRLEAAVAASEARDIARVEAAVASKEASRAVLDLAMRWKPGHCWNCGHTRKMHMERHGLTRGTCGKKVRNDPTGGGCCGCSRYITQREARANGMANDTASGAHARTWKSPVNGALYGIVTSHGRVYSCTWAPDTDLKIATVLTAWRQDRKAFQPFDETTMTYCKEAKS